MALTDVLVALAVAVGLVGILVPVLPGTCSSSAPSWSGRSRPAPPPPGSCSPSSPRFLAAGTVVKYAVPGRRLQAAGVPTAPWWSAACSGVVGFFVVPVVGLVLGFVLGVYARRAAAGRARSRAWPSTRRALQAVGLSDPDRARAAGLLAAVTWLVGRWSLVLTGRPPRARAPPSPTASPTSSAACCRAARRPGRSPSSAQVGVARCCVAVLALLVVGGSPDRRRLRVGRCSPASAAAPARPSSTAASPRGRMGVVAPVSAVGAAVVPVVGRAATGERPSLVVWLGIAAALPGDLAGLPRARRTRWRTPARPPGLGGGRADRRGARRPGLRHAVRRARPGAGRRPAGGRSRVAQAARHPRGRRCWRWRSGSDWLPRGAGRALGAAQRPARRRRHRRSSCWPRSRATSPSRACSPRSTPPAPCCWPPSCCTSRCTGPKASASVCARWRSRSSRPAETLQHTA